MKEKVIPVVIQISRINESFPNRCFCNINGVSVLESLIERIKDEYGASIILATSDREEDIIFDEIATRKSVKIYHGNYRNIVSRLLGASEFFRDECFIRVFANYQLLDIA